MKENKLIVADTGWAESIPEWLKEEVKSERIVSSMIELLGKVKVKEEVGDAEACLYLFTLALKSPMSHDTGQIYIYLSAKLCKSRGMELVSFMEEKIKTGLGPDEERELTQLKRDLWSKRGGKIKHPLIEALKQMEAKT